MNLQNKYMLLVALAFIIIPVVQSSLTGNIGATDWIYRHNIWVNAYIRGDWSPILYYYPLFELFMTPFVALNLPVIFLQIVFVILATFGILFLAYKVEGEKAMIYMAILLAASIAFVSGASQLMPQSLDYFLFPLAIYFYSTKRVNYSVGLLIIDFLMHGTGFIFIGILALHSLLTKNFKYAKIFILLLVLLFPLFWYYTWYAPYNVWEGGFIWDATSQALWEQQYIDPFWKFFALSGFLTWILLPFALVRSKFKFSEMQLLYAVWFIAFLSFIPFQMGIWRMVTYQIVPLSLFVISVMKNEGDKQIQKIQDVPIHADGLEGCRR